MIASMNGLPNVSTANTAEPAQDAAVSRSVAPVPRAAHTPLEDVQGILTGCLFVALSLAFMRDSRLLPGGIAGVSFLLHYGSGWSLGAVLFAVNLPC